MFGFSTLNHKYVPLSRKAISIATIAVLTLSMLVPIMLNNIATPAATTTTTTSAAATEATSTTEILGEAIPVVSAPVEAKFAGEGSNDMSSANLLPGDIICIGTDDTLFDWLIPGKWSHTVIFGGVTTAANQRWDTEHGCWMGSGVAWVIHSTQDDIDSGLRTSTFQCVVNDHADNVVAMRVLKPGGAFMSAAERDGIVTFCTSKLGLDEGYDWNWLDKQIGIDSLWPAPKGYYCSELAWAAYKNNLGINLDGDFSPLDVGVSPEDLYWSESCQVIALEMNSDPNGNGVPGGAYAVDASSNLYKIDMWIYQVKYDDDYEPWYKGDGEMYLKCWIGEAYFPSCAETHQTGDTNWDMIDDAGDDWKSGVGSGDTVTWNGHHYALVSYNSYMKIRLQAMEEDSPDGDDAYPAFQWWWAPSSWHGYIDGGWYGTGGLYDMGDCRYYILFSVTSCY